jgi:hypothetical protein
MPGFGSPILLVKPLWWKGEPSLAPLYPPIYIPRKQPLFDKTCRLSFLNIMSFCAFPRRYEFLIFKTSLLFHIPVNENAESTLISLLEGGGALSVGCQIS